MLSEKFGFHTIYKNIVRYIENVNVEGVKNMVIQ